MSAILGGLGTGACFGSESSLLTQMEFAVDAWPMSTPGVGGVAVNSARGHTGVDGAAVAGWGLYSEKAQTSCGCLGLENIVSHLGHFTIQADRMF